jgi:hypothetical protein
MWKAVSCYRESSDPAFIVWRIEAKNVDGRKQTVYVKIDTSVVANEQMDDWQRVAFAMCATQWKPRGHPSSSR